MKELAVIQIDTPEATKPTKSILIVDDDRSALDTLARLLKLEVRRRDRRRCGDRSDHRPGDAAECDHPGPPDAGRERRPDAPPASRQPDLVEVPVGMVTGDYFMPEATAAEIKSLGASLRFKPMWLEDLLALARTLVAA